MISYAQFLAHAREIEVGGLPLPDDTFFYREAYEVAKHDASKVVKYYSDPFFADRYILYYGLHLLCLTMGERNPLHQKYFAKGLGGLGYVVTSTSDATSSASALGYKSLNEMDFREAMLTSTPYGKQVLAMLEPLKNLIVGG